MCSVAGHVGPAVWVFSTGGFHHFFATKPVSSETSKAARGQMWRPWFYPRLVARSTQGLTYQLRLALEPECPENLTATAREIPRDGADSLRDTQAVCGFRYWASKLTPLFHTINTIVAIFRARVRRAISGLIPLATKAA